MRSPAHLLRTLLRRLHRPAGRADLASLEERLGLLLLVRLALAAAVLLVAGLAPAEIGLTIGQAGVPTAIYVAVTTVAELSGRRSRQLALAAHRVMLPLDAVYLVVMTVPAGGPRSQLIVLFSSIWLR